MQKKRAVVFSGGGSKGGYQVGVWKALRELGFLPNIVTGTSVGALNGALMALNKYEDAVNIWENMGMDSVFAQFVESTEDKSEQSSSDRVRIFLEALRHGGADYTPLQNTVKTLMDEPALRRSPIAFGLVTTAFPKIKPTELFIEDIPEGQAADYVIASAAAFPFLKTYKIGEAKYVDGGYSDNMPINMAIRKGATEIVAVNIGNMGLKKISDHVKIHYVHSRRPLTQPKFGSIVLFNKENSQRNMRLGYLDTMKAFGMYEGWAYTFENYEKYKAGDYENACSVLFDHVFSNAPYVSRAEKNARENMLSLLRSYDDRPFAFHCNVICCAEMAAEILNVSPLEIYTLEHLTDLILENAKSSMDDAMQARIENLSHILEHGSIPNLLRSFAERSDKLLLTLYCFNLLQKSELTALHRKQLWGICSTAPDAFCAALFIAGSTNDRRSLEIEIIGDDKDESSDS